MDKPIRNLKELQEERFQAKLDEEARAPLVIHTLEVSKERTYKVIGTNEYEVRKSAELVYNWLVKGWRHVD